MLSSENWLIVPYSKIIEDQEVLFYDIYKSEECATGNNYFLVSVSSLISFPSSLLLSPLYMYKFNFISLSLTRTLNYSVSNFCNNLSSAYPSTICYHSFIGTVTPLSLR